MNAITEAYSLLKPEEIARAMYYFEKAERVYFFGVGASMVTALAATNKFLRITPKVNCLMDSHMQAMVASMLNERDFAIVISYSGETKDSIHSAKLAKEGPLKGGSTSAQMSELYLIDLLYMRQRYFWMDKRRNLRL